LIVGRSAIVTNRNLVLAADLGIGQHGGDERGKGLAHLAMSGSAIALLSTRRAICIGSSLGATRRISRWVLSSRTMRSEGSTASTGAPCLSRIAGEQGAFLPLRVERRCREANQEKEECRPTCLRHGCSIGPGFPERQASNRPNWFDFCELRETGVYRPVS